jgi:hypothetical protein
MKIQLKDECRSLSRKSKVNRGISKGIMPTCSYGKSEIMISRSGDFWLAPRTYYNGTGKEMYMELKTFL